MPFTPAHPAIVLPFLKRRGFSALGLVIGSMAPDFEYFFKMRVSSAHSHTLAGLLYFDLPVTFLLSWIFIKFVKGNLLANLPPFLQRRFRPMQDLNMHSVLVSWFVFACSALLGSMSHILWDGFTHGNTFFVRNLSFYHGTYVPYEGVKYPLWYALQHISTAIGLAVMIIYVVSLPPQPGMITRPSLAYWLVVLTIAATMVATRFYLHPEDLKEGNFVVSTISGLCGGVILAGMINFNNAVQEAEQQDG
ncbi:MAG: DUF4184 family protein [Chryseolinea sp.]